MKITRSALNEIVKKILLEDVERVAKSTPTQRMIDAFDIVAGIAGSELLSTISQRSHFAQKDMASLIEEIVGDTFKIAGTFLGVYGVFQAFTYLPELFQEGVETIRKIEGWLMYARQRFEEPVSLDRIKRNPSNSPREPKSWSRDQMVDYIAGHMESPAGRALFGSLVASKYEDTNGVQRQGPIIDQKFADAIQLRRKSIKEEAGEDLKKALLAKIKSGKISEENLDRLISGLTSKS